MRWTGRLKLGWFPLPLSEAERIRKFLLYPEQPSSALDPCVGDGGAFAAISGGAEVVRYGIELDAYRAEQARERIAHVIQGNTLEVHCPVESFGLLYDIALMTGPSSPRPTVAVAVLSRSFLPHLPLAETRRRSGARDSRRKTR